MMQELSAEDFAALVGTGDEPLVLDVRDREEVAAWPMPGAVNIPLSELPTRHPELPRDRDIVALCASGRRSSQAVLLLEEIGLEAANLAGGMAAWSQVYDTVAVELRAATLLQVRRRGKGCLSYLIGAGGEAFVVDPSTDVHVYVDAAASRGWRITRVFDTHLHADHVSGARQLAEATGASLHLNPADPFDFPFVALADGDRFRLPGGAELSVAVVPTPGHTEGSTIYAIGDEALLSGDTLFVDGVGRPDLAERAEAFARNLYRSLHERVLPLGPQALVLPAHYGSGVAVTPRRPVGASLGQLREKLAALSLDEEAFVGWATAGLGERPSNYHTIVEINRGRRSLPPEAAASLEAGPNRCSA